MKNIKKYLIIPVLAILTLSCVTATKRETPMVLKDAFADSFLMGTALSEHQLLGGDPKAMKLVKEHFNAIVAENCMKSERLQPSEGEFTFSLADKFVEYGEKNNMFITGHTLVWHSQAPKWFFTDDEGNDVSRNVLIERMKKHIYTVVGRYKGRVKGWDVVNEAILDDGSYRNSKFYQIIGEDFIQLAFQFAHDADPDAALYYNDYSMHMPGKRQGVITLVKKLQHEGVRIDGIGMQSHIGIDSPNLSDFENSLKAFIGLGINVMITELDLSVLPMPDNNVGAEVSASFNYQQKLNPYVNGLPDSVSTSFARRYLDFFGLLKKYQQGISRVTFWGVYDAQSWKNDWPVVGRTDYPLLFDRKYQAKPVLYDIIKQALIEN